jgi:hypothetical protein
MAAHSAALADSSAQNGDDFFSDWGSGDISAAPSSQSNGTSALAPKTATAAAVNAWGNPSSFNNNNVTSKPPPRMNEPSETLVRNFILKPLQFFLDFC